MHDRSGAHDARLEGRVERAADQPVVAEPASCVAQGSDLRVRGRIARGDRQIAAAADHLPVAHHDRPDGHFAARRGIAGERERFAHHPRVEYDYLLRGNGRFIADAPEPGQTAAAFVRSPHAYARIRGINTDAAKTAKVIVRLHDKETGAKIVQAKYSVPPLNSITVLLSDTGYAAAGTAYRGMALVFARGATPPALDVSVNTPYGDPKLKGTTGYTCSPMP